MLRQEMREGVGTARRFAIRQGKKSFEEHVTLRKAQSGEETTPQQGGVLDIALKVGGRDHGSLLLGHSCLGGKREKDKGPLFFAGRKMRLGWGGLNRKENLPFRLHQMEYRGEREKSLAYRFRSVRTNASKLPSFSGGGVREHCTFLMRLRGSRLYGPDREGEGATQPLTTKEELKESVSGAEGSGANYIKPEAATS